MHNDKKGSNQKGDSLMTQKTNEDFNKKRPRLGDPGLKQNLPTKELPLVGQDGEMIDTDIRMTTPFGASENDVYETDDIFRNDYADTLDEPITSRAKSAVK